MSRSASSRCARHRFSRAAHVALTHAVVDALMCVQRRLRGLPAQFASPPAQRKGLFHRQRHRLKQRGQHPVAASHRQGLVKADVAAMKLSLGLATAARIKFRRRIAHAFQHSLQRDEPRPADALRGKCDRPHLQGEAHLEEIEHALGVELDDARQIVAEGRTVGLANPRAPAARKLDESLARQRAQSLAQGDARNPETLGEFGLAVEAVTRL